MELSQCLTATTYETMRSVLAWCVSELIRLVEGTCLVFAILDMVLFWKERGGRCCMFRMGLYNSQILQLLSESQYGLYSLMLRVFNRSGKCCMLHRNRDVTGLDHVPSQRFKPLSSLILLLINYHSIHLIIWILQVLCYQVPSMSMSSFILNDDIPYKFNAK